MSTFGSAGDLFPLVPLLAALRDAGHDVRCAASRSLGLYLRSAGFTSVALGDGSELGVVDDREIFTTRFDGWSSWRRTLLRYVAPTLVGDVARLEAVFEGWMPDVVVSSGFAVAARVAAARAGISQVVCSIYPQHLALSEPSSAHLGVDLRGLVRSLAGADADLRQLVWGAPADLLLHDPAMLDDEAGAAVGFPYWDAVPSAEAERSSIDRWLEVPGPHLLVTLGSFVGLARRSAWLEASEAIAHLGVRGVLVGARGPWAQEAFVGRPDLLCVGFQPLSGLLSRFDGVVHHGGLGTTMATVRAGRPAVVVPQAFDQSHNARLVERRGIGVDGSSGPLVAAIEAALAKEELTAAATRMAGVLVDPDEATAAAVDAVLAAASGAR